jgi:beta-lactam-binding protein with PASTA domain
MRRKPSRSNRLGIRKVNVPNLSGLSRSQAKTALESVGLTWTETSSTMQNINLDNVIESQGTASGTAVKIGDSVSFSYYVYVAPPPPPPPSAPPSGPPADPPSGCTAFQ